MLGDIAFSFFVLPFIVRPVMPVKKTLSMPFAFLETVSGLFFYMSIVLSDTCMVTVAGQGVYNTSLVVACNNIPAHATIASSINWQAQCSNALDAYVGIKPTQHTG